MQSPANKVVDVTPEELGTVIDRCRQEQSPELVVVGPNFSTNQPEFRGKTVHRLTIHSPSLAHQLMALGHLQHLVLAGLNISDADVGVIARHLGGLTSLDLSQGSLGEAGARAIAEHLRQLTSLDLGGNRIGETGARTIAEHLTQLTSLDVGGNGIGTVGVQAIAKHLPELTSLSTQSNDIGEAGARSIAGSLAKLEYLDIGNNKIGGAGAKALANHLPKLTSLSAWGNSLGHAGLLAIAEHLTQLRSLHAGLNEAGDEGAEAIAEYLTQLSSLNIGSNKIGDGGVRAIAQRLRQLTDLSAGHNQIATVGALAVAEHLTRLTSLDLGFNRGIADAGVRAVAERLTQLEDLNVGNSGIGVAGAGAIAEHLSKLTSLDVGFNDIGEVGARILAQSPAQLTELDIGRCGIGNAGIQAIAEGLPKLTSLTVYGNSISDDGARAVAAHLTQLRFLNAGNNSIGTRGTRALAERLQRLDSLHLSENKIGDSGVQIIANSLPNLHSLSVGSNDVGDAGVGAIDRNLASLRRLSLEKNKRIKNLGALAERTNLRWLNLSGTSVRDLSPLASRIEAGWPVNWQAWTRSEGVAVEDCPLENPPVEIARQGPDAVRNYFIERSQQAVARLYEAKVLIVGDGGVGKTSLLRRLYRKDLPLPAEDETTRGIAIHRQDFLGEHGGPFRLNIWDFGGQQIYHATHQFFLTKSSLYVLVDDTRKSDKSIQDESFKFWFEVVETLSDKSPLLIFQNEKGGRSKAIDLAGIKGRFPNIIDVIAGNLEHADAADRIRQAIQFHVQRLPHIGSEVPTKWLSVRETLEAESVAKPFITQDEYFAIYGRHLAFDRTKALFLSRYLHDLGVFLHFQDDLLLRKTVVLQNQWATDAVFRVLDDEAVKKGAGRFTLADCARVWADARYADMQAELIGLMQKFELCYALPDSDPRCWLAPQLLSPSTPAGLATWAMPSDLVVRLRYPFLPRGLVSRLMVRQHRFVKQVERSWARGAFFQHDGTEAIVLETPHGNELEFRARGPEKKALLSVLVSDVEAINQTFQGLRDRVDRLVPCICSVCRTTTDPQMYRHPELVERKLRNKRTIECRREPYEDVSVLELLDGIEVDRLPDWATAPPEPARAVARHPLELTVFLASSAELREDRDAFDLYFRQQNDRLRKNGIYLKVDRWENFLDAMSDTRLQNEYNKRVRACDIFVSLFRTKAGTFTGEEFDVAFDQFKRSGKPKVYTYFKEATISVSQASREDLTSLWDFKAKLTKLGHFFTPYESVEHLKRHFKDQLEMLLDL